ncbi:MAG: hypothetical protein JST59_00975 [Actinobacteria bacterium]|nr:hypothetical protein [Actinomycetota bacterium]
MYLELFVDDHFYNVPACSETCITQLPKDFAHVTVAFKKFRNSAMVPIFLQTEEEQIYTLTISDTDSIGMKVSRLSELSREIILYSTHIIRNQTYEDFSIEYEGRVYNLERYFWLFITDSNIHNKKRKGKIWLYKSDIKDAQKVMNFVTNAQVVKLERPNEETAEERARKLVIDVPKRKRVTFTKEPICDNKCGNGCRKCLKGCG